MPNTYVSPNIDNADAVASINQGLKATGGLIRKGAANVYRVAKRNPREAGLLGVGAVGGMALANSDPLLLGGSALVGGYLLSKYKFARPKFSSGLLTADFASYPYYKDNLIGNNGKRQITGYDPVTGEVVNQIVDDNRNWRTAKEYTVSENRAKSKKYSQPLKNEDKTLRLDSNGEVITDQKIAKNKIEKRKKILAANGSSDAELTKSIKTLRENKELREALQYTDDYLTIQNLKDRTDLTNAERNRLVKSQKRLDAIGTRYQAEGKAISPQIMAGKVKGNSKAKDVIDAYNTVNKIGGTRLDANGNRVSTVRDRVANSANRAVANIDDPRLYQSTNQQNVNIQPVVTNTEPPVNTVPNTTDNTSSKRKSLTERRAKSKARRRQSSSSADMSNVPKETVGRYNPNPSDNEVIIKNTETRGRTKVARTNAEASVKAAEIAANGGVQQQRIKGRADIVGKGIDALGRWSTQVTEGLGNVAGKAIDAAGGVAKEVAGVPKQMAQNVGNAINTWGDVRKADIAAKAGVEQARIQSQGNIDTSRINAESANQVAKIQAQGGVDTAKAKTIADDVVERGGLLDRLGKGLTNRRTLMVGGGLLAAGGALVGGKMYLDYMRDKEDRDRQYELDKLYAMRGVK